MKLEQDLEQLLKLDLLDQASQQGFEWFTKYIVKNEVRQTANNFLANFKLDINSREFLSSYILASFPDITLSCDRNDLEEDVYQRSLSLTSCVSVTPFLPEQFIGLCQTYRSCFNSWKNKDKDDLIKIIAKTINR